MLQKFKKYIADNIPVKSGNRVLLAVSGGIDSMVMTHLFMQLDYDLGIAHCNFTLRSNESDLDEKMVHSFANQHNISFYSKRFNTKAYSIKNRLSIQMAARDLRYKWFEDIREQNRYDFIALAHNLNDNIETLIINLTRGTGITGMAGIRPVSSRIIRPMLFAHRNEIEEYCKLHQITFREDKSNSETKYVRNKIRHLVIPVLKEINPSIESTLNETSERFTGLNEIINEYINKLRENISDNNDDNITFNISLLKPHLHNMAVIYELFKPFGINNVHLTDLLKVAKGKTGGQLYTGTHRILKNREELIVSLTKNTNTEVSLINDIHELREFHRISSVKLVNISSGFIIPSEPSTACLDSEKISFPLIIRKWEPGDYFFPLGMKNRKKLSDYFIDNKYSILEKENSLILESSGKIVWLIGDRIDNRFRINKTTEKALIIKALK